MTGTRKNVKISVTDSCGKKEREYNQSIRQCGAMTKQGAHYEKQK